MSGISKAVMMHQLIVIVVGSPLVMSAYQKIIFLISQPKHMLWVLKRDYVVGTQKNRLNETVLLSTQNIS